MKPKIKKWKKWEDQFGDEGWESDRILNYFAKKSLEVLMNSLEGAPINDEQGRMSRFVVEKKVWPKNNYFPVQINILRLEDLQTAKEKAGLLLPKKT